MTSRQSLNMKVFHDASMKKKLRPPTINDGNTFQRNGKERSWSFAGKESHRRENEGPQFPRRPYKEHFIQSLLPLFFRGGSSRWDQNDLHRRLSSGVNEWMSAVHEQWGARKWVRITIEWCSGGASATWTCVVISNNIYLFAANTPSPPPSSRDTYHPSSSNGKNLTLGSTERCRWQVIERGSEPCPCSLGSKLSRKMTPLTIIESRKKTR